MNCIIVDDEAKAISALKKELELFVPHLKIVATCQSLKDAQREIDRLKPELVFLDIKLDDGSGFDLFTLLNFQDFELIFTTAYSHFAIDALRAGAADYLMKPICGDDILQSMERIHHRRKKTEQQIQSDSLSIHYRGEKRVIPFKDIIRFQSLGNYTWIFPAREKPYLVPMTLKYMDEKCPDFFIRCHKSHIVNGNYIQSYQLKTSEIHLTTGQNIPVSSRKKSLLNKYLKGGP